MIKAERSFCVYCRAELLIEEDVVNHYHDQCWQALQESRLIFKVFMKAVNEDLRNKFLSYINERTTLEKTRFTIGLTFHILNIKVDDRPYILYIFDFVNLERSNQNNIGLCQNALAELVIFDKTQEDSFELMKKWIADLWNQTDLGKIPIAIVGCNVSNDVPDLVSDETVTKYCDTLSNQTKERGFEIRYYSMDIINKNIAKTCLNNLGQDIVSFCNTLCLSG